MGIEFDYFYGQESQLFSFYRIPKQLVTDERFRNISAEAKLLYGMMFDRMALSQKNEWFDERNRAYIIYTIEDIISDLAVCRQKAVKVISELDAKSGIGLIERIRRGLGKPDIIYVKKFYIEEIKNSGIEFDYFYGQESQQFSFYRIPKQLVTDERFTNISAEAKLLYGMMLDRMALSQKNEWFDERNRAYIIYTIEDIISCLAVCRQKAVKVISELDAKSGIGLIERIRRGLGKPDIIYVKKFYIEANKIDSKPIEKSQKYENHTSESMNIRLQEVPNTNFCKYENHISEDMKNELQEVRKSYPSNINNNYTDSKNTDSINLLSSSESEEQPPKTELVERKMEGRVKYSSFLEECKSTIFAEGEIPYTWTAEPDKMRVAVQVMSNWDSNKDLTGDEGKLYRSFVSCLSGMLCDGLTTSNLSIPNLKIHEALFNLVDDIDEEGKSEKLIAAMNNAIGVYADRASQIKYPAAKVVYFKKIILDSINNGELIGISGNNNSGSMVVADDVDLDKLAAELDRLI